MSTTSRCAARRSVSVKPHARTKHGSRHAALRAAEIYKPYGYTDLNKIDALALRYSAGRSTGAT